MVELNSDVLKTLHSLQAELKSFREESLNERKEQPAINEALLRNRQEGARRINLASPPTDPKENRTMSGTAAQEK